MLLALFGITNDGLNLVVNLVVLFLVVVWLALIAWTYLDARRRIGDPVLVACATGASLFPYIGTVVYSILRPPEFLEDAHERELEIRAAELRVRQLEEQSCPNCGYPIERTYLRCPNCRARVKDPCESCEKPIDPRWTICPYCETPQRRAVRQPRRAARGEPRTKRARDAERAGRGTPPARPQSRPAATAGPVRARQPAQQAQAASGRSHPALRRPRRPRRGAPQARRRPAAQAPRSRPLGASGSVRRAPTAAARAAQASPARSPTASPRPSHPTAATKPWRGRPSASRHRASLRRPRTRPASCAAPVAFRRRGRELANPDPDQARRLRARAHRRGPGALRAQGPADRRPAPAPASTRSSPAATTPSTPRSRSSASWSSSSPAGRWSPRCSRATSAVVAARQLIGATNPLEAAPGSIRGDFALEVTFNLVHGSDSDESAEREIAIWFRLVELRRS